MHLRKAFTLIELLVVIAIIAILAAILFPVLSQARVAAKGAASISNATQILRGAFIYMADHDDRGPLVGINGERDSPFLLNGTYYKPWAYLILPYMKAGAIYQDPLRRMESQIPPRTADDLWSYRTHFGYAYTVQSPTNYTGGKWVSEPVAQTSIAKPADTVIFASKKGRDNTLDWLWVGSPIWMANLVAPPYCVNSTMVGTVPDGYAPPNVRWGSNGYPSEAPTEMEGRYTGGVAIRKAGQAVVVFSDGHVKGMSPGALAAGTNWRKNATYQTVRITDKEKYLWDIE